MSWRTVIITKRCKLDLKMGYMEVRGDEIDRIYLDEMALLVIENPAVSLTGCLLEALTAQKIRVIFCDSKRSPMAELVPYHGSHDSSRKIKMQTSWSDEIKGIIWREIVAEKIRKQAEFLSELKKETEATLLRSYLSEIALHDATNREGPAAKVYFNALFGMCFTRSEENVTNAALNYGYGILLSAFNREINALGYLTQIGIWHDNVFNHYNLSCDLMEPFRILVDRVVYQKHFSELNSDSKHEMWNILNQTIWIGTTQQTVLNGIKFYVRTVFEALNDEDASVIRFYKNI